MASADRRIVGPQLHSSEVKRGAGKLWKVLLEGLRDDEAADVEVYIPLSLWRFVPDRRQCMQRVRALAAGKDGPTLGADIVG